MSREPEIFILMTALPPTKGHENLIKFAQEWPYNVKVIVCTQPDEPFALSRFFAIKNMVAETPHWAKTRVYQLHEQIEQNPNAPGFWEMWENFLFGYGLREGDFIMASEPYGKTLADKCGVKFIPFDLRREILPSRATEVRGGLVNNFDQIMRTFQNEVRTTVTFFGAESTGKTTTSKAVANRLGGHWLFEYARPYLENTSTEINVESMTGIWKGQKALQELALKNLWDRQLLVQDTDLFTTVGYWNFRHWRDVLGKVPEELVHDALVSQSDLYLITSTEIPFEEDPIRYGGDKRESDDQYWIDLCEEYALPYAVINSTQKRVEEAVEYVEDEQRRMARKLHYAREVY